MSTQDEMSSAVAINYADPIQLMSVFYKQIVEVKRCIEKGTLIHQVSMQLKLGRDPTKEEVAEAISLRLQNWMEHIRVQAKKVLTDREYECIDQALYAMAALADELFIIEIEWVGNEHWEQVLLEQKLYGTSFAGETIFNRIKTILNKRTLDPQHQKLVAVYLFALRLGFAGRYREEAPRLNYLREQLYKRIGAPLDQDVKVCTQAYQQLKAAREEQRLAPLTTWYRNIVLCAMGYALLSWGVWFSLSGHWGS